MKKLLWVILMTITLASCSGQEETIDLSNFFGQVCADADSKCLIMQCVHSIDTYNCAESVQNLSTTCSSVKKFDNIIEQYKICWTASWEGLFLFAYSKKHVPEFAQYSANEFTNVIEKEMEKVENWWESDFLGRLMTWIWGWLIWGYLANKMFWSSNAMPPPRTPTQSSQPYNKSSLNNTKTQVSNNASNLNSQVSKSKSNLKSKSSSSSRSSSRSRSSAWWK